MKNYLKITGVVVATVVLSNVAFGYGIAANGIFDHGTPVHELMTRKAAIDSGYIFPSDTYQMNHLLEGVRFNDDPESHLAKGDVLGFASKFLGDNKGKKNATELVHFGNYQFVHAMAKGGMPAHQVKSRMMLYAYHCWLSATDSNSYAKFQSLYGSVLAKNKANRPNSDYSREELIMKDAVKVFPYEVLSFQTNNQNSFQNRAMGSLLHMIQDSYAKGHTVRQGWEDGSNSGAILYFQDYKQQDSHQHDQYDVPKSGKTNEATLSEIPGIKTAYLRSKQVLEMAKKGCPWSGSDLEKSPSCSKSMYSFLSKEVFALDQSSGQSPLTHSHKALTEPIKNPQQEFNDMYGGG